MKKRCSVENLIYSDETWIRLISNSLLISSVTDPDSHLTLSNRSHALYRLNRCEAALADADRAVTLQPYWGKVSWASPLNTKLSRQTPWIVLITLALQAGCLGTDSRVGYEKKKVMWQVFTGPPQTREETRVLLWMGVVTRHYQNKIFGVQI